MKKRHEISEEVREDAAVMCAAMADWWGGWPAGMVPSPRSYWSGTAAECVAEAAYDAVFVKIGTGLSATYREAEALLRDGWCLGDPVRRRKVSP